MKLGGQKSLGHTRENPRWYLIKSHPFVQTEVLSDRSEPLLTNPPVWRGRMKKLAQRVEEHLRPTWRKISD